MSKLIDSFPHDTARDPQVEILNFAEKEFLHSDKKFLIIEAGTGVGKSAIGFSIARHLATTTMSNSYFLTTQKILQEQYVDDFSRLGMRSLKSSANYQCTYHKSSSCGESSRQLRNAERGSRFWNNCMMKCPYKNAKSDFIAAHTGVTNFSYFLAETAYSGKLKHRDLLVIDEAHNTELELSRFVEVVVTERFSKHQLKIDMPDLRTQVQAERWVREVYTPKARSHKKHIEKMLEKYHGLKEKAGQFSSFAKQFDLLDKHVCKIDRFLQIYDKENWVCNLVPADGRRGRRLEFKPVDVSPYSDEMLFKHGDKVVLMSATILDKDAFCETLGIDKSNASFISMPSPFPTESRPIVAVPVGKMSSKMIDMTLPKMVEMVRKLLAEHPNEKGIIHCHTYKIANHLKRSLRSNRILVHDSTDRDQILEKHKNSNKPTVLLTPSMTEGVDLKDEYSRFQIICKIPYPYLGDKIVKKRMHKWKWWYSLQTAKSIIQSVGRSVRSEKDFAVTYILDEDWLQFYRRNKSLFPKDFHECYKSL